MGAPKGHCFFGNQYTDGGYKAGTYTYAKSAAENIAKIVANEKNIANNSIKNPSVSMKNIQNTVFNKYSLGKDKIIIGGTLLAVASISGVITYKVLKRGKKLSLKKTVELENVGVCTKCRNPLLGSELHLEKENNEVLYIECKNCATKNYEHTEENSDSTESL